LYGAAFTESFQTKFYHQLEILLFALKSSSLIVFKNIYFLEVDIIDTSR